MKTRTQRIIFTIPFTLAVIMIATRLDFYYDTNMTIRFIATFLVAFPACYWAAGGTKEGE